MPLPDREASAGNFRRLALPLFLVAVPAIAFYVISTWTAVNLPLWDDYDAGLAYLNHLITLPGLWGKVVLMLTSQHNEYKLLYVNVLFWGLHALFGKINFVVMSVLGNLQAIPVALSLWLVFRPKRDDLHTKLLLFLPSAYLWFLLNYAETVNWGVDAFQTMPVVALAFFCVYLLLRPTRTALVWAIVCMIGSIASSANGFLLAPIGAWILFRQRRFSALWLWLVVTALSIGGYFYRYEVIHYPPPPHHSLPGKILIRVEYFLAFLGNALGERFIPCALLGIALCIFWFWMWRRGYLHRRPALTYCLLFIALTTAMVSAGRADLGLMTSMSSRYRLYGDIMLIFTWQAVAEEFIDQRGAAVLRNPLFRWASALAILFAIGSDIYGYRYLHDRKLFQQRGMYAFEHPSPANPQPNSVLPLPYQGERLDKWDIHARQVLLDSMRLRTYEPPPL